jgi:hypothetical protein
MREASPGAWGLWVASPEAGWCDCVAALERGTTYRELGACDLSEATTG